MRLLFINKYSGFGLWGHTYQVGNNSLHFEYTYIHIVHDIRGEGPNVILLPFKPIICSS